MCILLLILILFIFAFQVLFDVVLGEEDKEHYCMSSDVVSIGHREPTIWDKEKLDGVRKDAHKLNHLQVSHVSFPPDVLFVLGSHGCTHVVQVHEDVNKCIQEAKEGGMTTRDPSKAKPNTERH